jgi:hypothetical protein
MAKKKRFKPTITRVKLSPEQAVLSCVCYTAGNSATVSGSFFWEGSWCTLTFGKSTSGGSGYEPHDSGSLSS